MGDKSTLLLDAKLAEQAERYEDMVNFMKGLVNVSGDAKVSLSTEERNLLSVAYKNVVGARRSAWRVLSSIEEKTANDPQKLLVAQEYKKVIEQELKDICNELIGLLDDKLILGEDENSSDDPESQIFFLKMKGDYYRYLCEVASEAEQGDLKSKSNMAYKEATKESNKLATTHPIRLGLALNYSVFHYEIMKQPDEACRIAKTAFDEAIAELDKLQEDSYKDSTLIMQLLRDNLTLWTTNENEAADDKDEEDS